MLNELDVCSLEFLMTMSLEVLMGNLFYTTITLKFSEREGHGLPKMSKAKIHRHFALVFDEYRSVFQLSGILISVSLWLALSQLSQFQMSY